MNLHRRAMRRRALEGRLARRHRSDSYPEPSAPDPELWAAVADLPLRQREVIVLRYLVDLGEADIAVALGISEGAASASLTKARRHLAEALRAREEVAQT